MQIGQNFHRLVMIEIENTYFNIFDDISETVKLGEDVQRDGLIKPSKLKDSLSILKMYRKLCDKNEITKTFAVAESFLGEAKNQKSFLEEVYNNTGFSINIFSKEDELKAIYSGVVNSVDVPKGVIIYIAPSSTSLIHYNRRNILSQSMLPYGYNTLLEIFNSDGKNDPETISKMKAFMKKEIKKDGFINNLDPETQFVGAGTVFASVSKLAKKLTHYPLDIENNYIVPSEVYKKVFEVVQEVGLDKTKKLKGVSSESVDVLTSGICIFEAITELFDIPQITVSADGMREGIIYNQIVPEANDKPFSDMLGYSLDTIRAFNDRKGSNTEQVYNVAVMLFKQLKVIHKLPRGYVKPLRIASSMYDCGKRIKFDNHTKYSFNVILNSRLNGVSQKEILLAAFACQCQNLEDFNLADWIKYKDILTEDDLEAVRKMGVLIKLADQLDKSRTKVVNDICCDILGDSVILKTVVSHDASFEIMEGMKLGPTFKKVFKKFIEII